MKIEIMLLSQIVLIGVGATIVMDLWALMLKRIWHIPSLNWAMVGRWIGHFASGKFRHANIAKSSVIGAELVLGWVAHYMIGIIFSALLVLILGQLWLDQPSLLIAVGFGLVTVVFPFLIMQPALGAGFFASKTPHPNRARILSLVAHSVFGVGLYATAIVLANS